LPVNRHGIEFQLFKIDQEKKIPLSDPIGTKAIAGTPALEERLWNSMDERLPILFNETIMTLAGSATKRSIT
jgi:hypothetical protein